ncbi:MAG: hypothetical protein ABL929_09955 [Ferruginibacter sp.]|nr:hypothetical protein [Ferruginibacter sp.]
MTTQIIVPTSNVFNLQVEIPKDLIGKKVSVSYEVDETTENPKTTNDNFVKASDIFKDCRVSLKDFKFNRDEANEYDIFFKKNKIDFKRDIDAFYDNIHLDMSNYKFNRDDANER